MPGERDAAEAVNDAVPNCGAGTGPADLYRAFRSHVCIFAGDGGQSRALLGRDSRRLGVTAFYVGDEFSAIRVVFLNGNR